MATWTMERIEANSIPEPNTGCWLWLLGQNGGGYGVLWVGAGRPKLAHRFVLAFVIGRELARHEHACHRCDQPACVNPAHLFVGSHADNMRDMGRKGRQKRFAGETNPGHVLTDALVVRLKEIVASGVSEREAARRMGLSPTTAHYAVSGKTWSHVVVP